MRAIFPSIPRLCVCVCQCVCVWQVVCVCVCPSSSTLCFVLTGRRCHANVRQNNQQTQRYVTRVMIHTRTSCQHVSTYTYKHVLISVKGGGGISHSFVSPPLPLSSISVLSQLVRSAAPAEGRDTGSGGYRPGCNLMRQVRGRGRGKG